MPRINSKLIKGLNDDQVKDLLARYENAKDILFKIKKEIQRDAETELQKLLTMSLNSDLSVEVAGILGRRQGLLETLTYFPEE